ncbi:MAG: response regulator [Candidatus Hydrogenedentota bacterium]
MSEFKRTAVIVDDEADVRAIVGGYLEDEGWQVIEAEDGEQAVLRALDSNPDLMVLDIMMPGGNGYEALRELRQDIRTAHVPIVMLTSVNEFELGRRQDAESLGRDAGVRPPEGFVEKPVVRLQLLEAARYALGD